MTRASRRRRALRRLRAIRTALRRAYGREPVVANTFAASAAVGLLGRLHVAVSPHTVTQYVAWLLPAIVGATAARRQSKPA